MSQAQTQATTQPEKFKYRRLGNTGLFVSEICFGAMTFGENQWKLPAAEEELSHKMLEKFASHGGNFIDTANIYGNGNSEAVLGKWLNTKRRDDFVIATKVRGRVGQGANDSGLSRKHILSQVENSLKALQTNYIDLLQVHFWDPATPLEETLSTLNDLVRAGKVRYLGASNFTGWQLQKAVDISKHLGLEKFISLQPQYHLLCRSTEYEILPVCENEGIGVICWSPLAGGILSGKYRRGEQVTEGRVAWAQQINWKHTSLSYYDNDQTWNLLDTIGKISAETKHSYAQISLRWLLQKPAVTCPIVGARTMEQLEDNLGAGFFTLTDEQMKLLDDVSLPKVPYPYAESYLKYRDDPKFGAPVAFNKTVLFPSLY